MNRPTLREIAKFLGGDVVSGGEVLAPGPGHSRRDRSMSIILSKTGKPIVHSFCGDDWRACIDFVNKRLGLSHDASKSRPEPRPRPRNVPAARPPDDDKARLRAALNIWDKACDPRGSIVEIYLKSRGLELPAEAANEAIRFHRDCPFGDETHPAMIGLVRNIFTNEPQAVHRTALAPDGTAIKRKGKTLRMSLGPIAGGAIKLSPDENVTLCLGIGEGIESTLSLRGWDCFGRSPVWSLISKSGVEALPVLAGIEAVWIAVDDDPGGIAAAEKVSTRWLEAGRETFKLKAKAAGSDLNDALRERACP